MAGPVRPPDMMLAKAWACAASTAVTSNCTMAAVSQQQEELAPGLLHALAVVSETLETRTREVEAEGRPTREATQLAKERQACPLSSHHTTQPQQPPTDSCRRGWVPRQGQ